MVVILGAGGFGIYFTYTKWQHFKNNPLEIPTYWQMSSTWKNIFIILCVTTGILFLLFIFIISRVRVAVAVIGEASKAVWSILSSLFFPLITSAMIIVCVGYWAMTCLFLATSKSPVFRIRFPQNDTLGPPCTELEMKTNGSFCEFTGYGGDSWFHRNNGWLQVLNLALSLWMVNFCIAFGEIVLAGAFASYYWAFSSKDRPFFPILDAFHRSLRYHVGTVALGSLIITIIQLIRITLEYINNKLKGSGNPVAKAIMCCLRCCFWLLEKCMRAINRNAYVITAIYGYYFCKAACEALGLFVRNLVRTAVLSGISFFVLFMGKVLITAIMGGLSWAFFSGRLEDITSVAVTNNTDTTVLKLTQLTNQPDVHYYWFPILVMKIF